MNFRTFDNFQKGFSHVKNGTECEDYADSYADPEGRFYICAVCDGHSDSNCFRSARGAKYGCESAIEVFSRFFELYYEEGSKHLSISDDMEMRLKKSIKQCWDNKVFFDISNNPITEEEMAPLSDRVRAVYESGRGLQNIYGATFLAIAVSNDLSIALHIGDGIMVCIGDDGVYYEPLEHDEKSNTGSPASLCDADLFFRKGAFRCVFSEKIPLAAVVSSDGIGDCMDELQFMEVFYSLLDKFETLERDGTERRILNDSQERYLESCVKYYAEKGNGVEDDCSLAGIYVYDKLIPKVKIPLERAKDLWQEAVREREEVIRDYERRKQETIYNIDCQMGNGVYLTLQNISDWLESKEKVGRLKEILRNIVRNEKDKLAYHEEKIAACEGYIQRAGGIPPIGQNLLKMATVEEKYLEDEVMYKDLRVCYTDWNNKNNQLQEVMEQQENIRSTHREICDKVKRTRDEAEKNQIRQEVEELEASLNELSSIRKEKNKAFEESRAALEMNCRKIAEREKKQRKEQKKNIQLWS